MIFLDTNVISEPTRIRPDLNVVRWIKENEGQSALSTIVLAELSAGIERIRPDLRAKRLGGFLLQTRSQFVGRIFSFDEESALIFGNVAGLIHRSGRMLKVADAMIAAITLRHIAMLATRNLVDFEFLNVKVVNPWG